MSIGLYNQIDNLQHKLLLKFDNKHHKMNAKNMSQWGLSVPVLLALPEALVPLEHLER